MLPYMFIATIFAAIIIVCQAIYNYLAHPVHDKVIRDIQKEDNNPDMIRVITGLLSFFSVIAGWMFFVVPMIAQNVATRKYPIIIAGALPGFVYGCVLNGTLYFVLHSVFQKFPLTLLVQELVWGISLFTISSAAFALTISQYGDQ